MQLSKRKLLTSAAVYNDFHHRDIRMITQWSKALALLARDIWFNSQLGHSDTFWAYWSSLWDCIVWHLDQEFCSHQRFASGKSRITDCLSWTHWLTKYSQDGYSIVSQRLLGVKTSSFQTKQTSNAKTAAHGKSFLPMRHASTNSVGLVLDLSISNSLIIDQESKENKFRDVGLEMQSKYRFSLDATIRAWKSVLPSDQAPWGRFYLDGKLSLAFATYFSVFGYRMKYLVHQTLEARWLCNSIGRALHSSILKVAVRIRVKVT